MSLCQSIFKESTSPRDLGKMEWMHLSVVFNRLHCTGKDRKNQQNRFLPSAIKFWLKNHVRWLHEMEFWPSKILQNGPTKTQREKSILCSLLFAFWVPKKHILYHCGIRKKHFASWHCEESISPRAVNPSNLQIDGSEIPFPTTVWMYPKPCFLNGR